jgi:hypothetical protein
MWVKSLGVLLLLIALVTGLGAACGGGGGEVDLSDADEVAAGALRAVSPPGQVGHLKWEESAAGLGTPLAEAWIDADNGRFRVEHRSAEGEEGSFTVGVGEKWRTAAYMASGDDPRPFSYIAAVDREEWAARGIDNLAYLCAAYLDGLASAGEKRVVGESTADGREVVVLEAKQPTDAQKGPGWMFVATVELDKATLLPVQFRSRTVDPYGTEGEVLSLAGFEWEAVSPDDLPSDFFSPDALFAEYSTAREELAEASKLGFELYWLGERYQGAAGGQLDLYLATVEWDMEADPEDWPELHYASEAIRGGAVIIREGPVGQAQFGPGSEVRGPIEQEEVAVLGQPATLYVAIDRLYCAHEMTYRWLVLTLGETAIELHPTPVCDEGQENNPLNNTEVLVGLAEDLAPVPDEP